MFAFLWSLLTEWCFYACIRGLSINDKKLCLAGVGDHGVLSTIVSSITRERRADLFLEVGGLVSPVREHVAWVNQKPLRVGDEIRVKIVETSSTDRPIKKH